MSQSSLYQYLNQNPKISLLALPDSKACDQAKEVADYLGYEPHLLSDIRALPGEDLRSYREEIFDTLGALGAYHRSTYQKKILLSPLRTLLQPLPKSELLEGESVAFGDQIDLKALKEKLFAWGYSFTDVVQDRGEVSVRGDIIDLFPPDEQAPVRISLFDIEIESIRRFDTGSQLCETEELESFQLSPAYFALQEEDWKTMSRAMENDSSDLLTKDIASLGLWHLGEKSEFLVHVLPCVLATETVAELDEAYLLDSPLVLRETFEALPVVPDIPGCQDIAAVTDPAALLSLHKNRKATVIARNEALLKQYGLVEMREKYRHREANHVLNILTPDELIISLNHKSKTKKRRKNHIILDELATGEYVVHEQYGIGIFQGITSAEVLGARRDFVAIRYQGEDRVLLPVENLDAIDRYIADSGSVPVLDRLGKGSFAKLKEKVKERLFAIAAEIIKVAAKREMARGSTVKSTQAEYRGFVESAGFAYTEDQQKSIEEIFSDLSSGRVMDRLLSADVGFGKTEVAMNALFMAVKSGLQCAVITPTTLLSHQHFLGMRQRMEPFGIRIAKLDRFVSAKEKKEVLRRANEGELDIIIGTHAILSVEWKRLGLVVVDEEHKFGVKQKEAIKNLRENTHLLSMSATPIPRTLNMALSKIKGMSQILTPPTDRLPVRTFVKEYDEGVVKEAILREMRRGGQVFYVFNNIGTIQMKQKELQGLLPDLKITILHSKISSSDSEKIMLDFAEKKYDLMLSTSIVESGIHLPNVNTMLVENADRFGIADLHQLRGRVGRASREGFCYFLVKDKEILTEEAKKRLVALENNSFLGSGSVLAYHDLEIRGGGNLIGEAQSGHIKNIGYALYLRMLEDAISQLSGEPESAQQKEVDIKLSVSAYLSPDLIQGDRVRLEIYRRLSQCEAVSEVHGIESEICDRFGKPDLSTQQFLQLIIIKILSRERNVKSIMNYGQNITLILEDERKVSLTSKSKDDDDILAAVLEKLRSKGNLT